jgi:hypothetical protein
MPLRLAFRARHGGQDNRMNLFFLPRGAHIELVSDTGKSIQSHTVRYSTRAGTLNIETEPQDDSYGGREEGGGPPPNDREPRRPLIPLDSAAVELELPLEETEPLVLQGKAA